MLSKSPTAAAESLPGVKIGPQEGMDKGIIESAP